MLPTEKHGHNRKKNEELVLLSYRRDSDIEAELMCINVQTHADVHEL